MIEPKPFSGVMDSDSPPEKVAPHHHVMAYNVVFKGEPNNLRAENVPGNRLVPNPSLPTEATCPIITGLMAMAGGTTIRFYFNDYFTPATGYTINLRDAADNTLVATQDSPVTYGSFTGVEAGGSYYVEVIVHCANGTDSSGVPSGVITTAAPSCAAVTSVTAFQNSDNGISYTFTDSVDATDTYSVTLYKAAGDVFVATQTITGSAGTFDAPLAEDTYYVGVIPSCSNGLTGDEATSATVTLSIAPPAGDTYTLVLETQPSGSDTALLVRCYLGGVLSNAPFGTAINVTYAGTEGGTPVTATVVRPLPPGGNSTFIFAADSISSYNINSVSPTTDGTNTYTF
jgi:hypothetical protein